MRTVMAILMMTLGYAGTAAAQQECSTDLIEMTGYKITPVDETTNRMTNEFRSNADKPIRMIDASAGFHDALGGSIGSFALDRDVSIQPGETFEQTGLWGPYTFERLLNLRSDEVETWVCVRAVLYDDGSKIDFSEVEVADDEKGDSNNDDQEAARSALFLLVAAKQCAETRGEPDMFAKASEQAEETLAKAGLKKSDIDETIASVSSIEATEENPVACALYERATEN